MFKGLFLDGSGFASTTNPDVNGDFTVVIELWKESWTPLVAESLAQVFEESGNQRSWDVKVGVGGTLQFVWSTDGAAVQTSESVVTVDSLVSAARESIALKIELDVDPGTVTMYSAPNRNGTFVQFFQESVGITSLFSSSADLVIGTAGLSNSVIRALEVYSDISTTLVVNAQFENEVRGTTSFVDDTTNTWTLSDNTIIIDGQTPEIGLWLPDSVEEMAEWAVADTPGELSEVNGNLIDAFVGDQALQSQQAVITNNNDEGPFGVGGGGSRQVKWRVINGIAFVWWDILFGTNPSIPALGRIEIELPVAADTTFHNALENAGEGDTIGEAHLYDNSAESGRQLATTQLSDHADRIRLITETGVPIAHVTGDDPWVPADGDAWSITATYKVAS